MSKKKIISLCLLLCLTVTAEKKEPKNKVFDDVIFSWLQTFGEVLQLANKKHYRIDDPEKAMIKSINGFLTTLDPHSSFLDPKTYRSILETTSGEFFGIGIVIDATRKPKDRFLMIIDVIPDGPSEKAGLLPYDKIIEINGKTLEGMTTEEATAKLRGEKDTNVHIKILREKKPEPIPFDIVRGVVKEQTSLSFYLKDHDIYYLSLTSFTSNAVKQIEKLLKKSTKKKYRGLILDLRNNSGGLLRAAVDIASLFVPKGSLVVTTRNKLNKETERYATKKNPITNNKLPIFILTNNFTASAAEILAGCLKMHSEGLKNQPKIKKKLMVFLVGSTTFGKGSVQEIVPVGNNCAAKITTSLYHLPDGTTIQGSGIKPDFTINKQFQTPEQIEWFQKFYGRESALKDYIKPHGTPSEPEKKDSKEKTDNNKKPKNWANRARENLAKDNQFLGAITLINLLDEGIKKNSNLATNRTQAEKYLKRIFSTNRKLNMDEIKA
ncbi:S41 family peptidase [bacterium]|nr:S41 family peptidase [bacterium]